MAAGGWRFRVKNSVIHEKHIGQKKQAVVKVVV